VSQYYELAAKRYRRYLWQKQKESWIHGLVTLVMHSLYALVRILQQAGIKRVRRVEKVNVEEEEEESR
jgi:hypothetical protein